MITLSQLRLLLILATVAAVNGNSFTAVVVTVAVATTSAVSGQDQFCDPQLRDKYCNAWYGGDLHTGDEY